MHKRTSSNKYQPLNNIRKTIQPKQFLSPRDKNDPRKTTIFLKKNYYANKQYKGTLITRNSPKPLTRCIYSNLAKDHFDPLKNKIIKKTIPSLKANLKPNCITPRENIEDRLSNIYPKKICENINYNNNTNDTEFNFASYGNLFEISPTISYTQSKNRKKNKMNKNNHILKSNKSQIIQNSKTISDNNYIDSLRSEIVDLRKLVGDLNLEITRINNNQETQKSLPINFDDKDKDSLFKKNKDLEKKNEHYLNIIKLKDILIKELEANQNSEKRTLTLESKQQNNDYTIEQEEKNILNEINDNQPKTSRTDDSSKKNSASFKLYEEFSKEYIKKIEIQNNKITELTIENTKLSLEIKEKDKINEKLSKEIEELQNRISSFINENNELEDKFNELESNKIMESVEKNIVIQDLDEKLNNLKIENLKKVSEQKNKIKILNDKIEILENELQNNTNNNNQIEQLIKIIKINQESTQKLKEEIQNLSESKLRNEKITELNEIISKNEENTNRVKAQIEALVLKISNLEKSNRNLSEQLKEKEDLISRFNNEVEKCENLQELRLKIKNKYIV